MDGTSEAVECASKELSDTMYTYDPFEVVGLIFEAKVRS